jgi:DNA ligase-1
MGATPALEAGRLKNTCVNFRNGLLRLRTHEGVQFLIGTGFSDAQRESPPPVGAQITYTHRGFTDRGVPRFANFLRAFSG